MSDNNNGKTCWFTGEFCEWCNAQIATNGKTEWCIDCGVEAEVKSKDEEA